MRGPAIPPFYAGEIGRRGLARRRAGLPVIPMHFGQPTAGAPATALAVAHEVLDADPLGYYESVPLTERIAQHYAETYGVVLDPRRVLLTAGASAGLVASFAALFRKGDRVAVVRPGYPAYRNALRAMGLVPVEMHAGPDRHFKPSAAMLEEIDPAPAGFILASPANPTGAMVDQHELGAIVEVCRTRGIRLISDEIYHGITYAGHAVSALEHDPRAIVINSFSKLYRMPGWRLGWMIVPEDWVQSFSAYLINMFLTPPTLSQHAALAAMDAAADLAASVATYARNRDRLIAGLAKLGITKLAPPDGAFYLYADIGHLTGNSLEFCIRAVDEIGVALAPGIDFDPDEGHRYVRFSFAVSPQQIDDALTLLAGWLKDYQDT
ncbi:MAG TPA: pyridoxal phosphate-dependent aminotransferase [Steroidobacteraceae bacterium]|nr:pyridoxal phosphate-dependent aminotransferase [Steroidobacteraceae bacterium]